MTLRRKQQLLNFSCNVMLVEFPNSFPVATISLGRFGPKSYGNEIAAILIVCHAAVKRLAHEHFPPNCSRFQMGRFVLS